MRRKSILAVTIVSLMLSACGSTQTAEITEPSTEAIEAQASTISEMTEAAESESITETEEATETSETAEIEVAVVDNFLTDNDLVDKITSDLTISGELRIGVATLDSDNNILGVMYDDTDDWMDTEQVAFSKPLVLDSISHMIVSGTDVYEYAFSYDVTCGYQVKFDASKLAEQYENIYYNNICLCFPSLFMVDPDKECGAVVNGYSYYDEQPDGDLIVQGAKYKMVNEDDTYNDWQWDDPTCTCTVENNDIRMEFKVYTSDIPTELYCAYVPLSQEYRDACIEGNAPDYDYKSDWNSHTGDWHLLDLIPTIQAYTGEITELGESTATTYDECTTDTDIETWGVYYHNSLAELQSDSQ